ncbi:MAG: GntR family transcriptional regulator [Propionicimonas sp.]
MSANQTIGENTADQIHQRLRDGILSGEYRPNQRLIEEDLAREMQVSRTPIREALLSLRQQGLVRRERGWQVRDHGPAEILEFLEARAELESSAARLAATRITDDELARLDELIASMESEPNRRQINLLNDEFHAVITDAARNYVLSNLARTTRINYWNFPTPVPFTSDHDAIVNAEHRELVAALRAGDFERAETVARQHVALTAQIITDALGLERTGRPERR